MLNQYWFVSMGWITMNYIFVDFLDVSDASRAGSVLNGAVRISANNWSIHARKLGSVKFNLTEILEAKRNFSLSFEIGQGGFGKVFKGRLKDGTLVAVKRAKKVWWKSFMIIPFSASDTNLWGFTFKSTNVWHRDLTSTCLSFFAKCIW